MRVAINGFGRIGRSVFKAALNKKINIVAINDIHGIDDALYLLKHDSIYGKYPEKVHLKRNHLIVNGKSIKIINERDPEKLPWKELKVDLVVESTGALRSREDFMKHVSSGAKKVLVTAPSNDTDVTIVPGVNDKSLKESHKSISVASCTTNAAAVVADVINKNFGIKQAMLSTVHGYTSSQSLVDSSNDKDRRRGRAAAINLVPTTTGSSETIEKVIPHLKGRITGTALRAPLADGSIIDFVAELKKTFTVEKVNSVFERVSKNELKGILEYSEEELVSSDIIGNPHSAIIDSLMTKKEGNLLKIFAWYDNEFGYSCRVVDVIKAANKK